MGNIDVLGPAGEAKGMLTHYLTIREGDRFDAGVLLEIGGIVDNIIAASVAQVEDRLRQRGPYNENEAFRIAGERQCDTAVVVVKNRVTHLSRSDDRMHTLVHLDTGVILYSVDPMRKISQQLNAED